MAKQLVDLSELMNRRQEPEVPASMSKWIENRIEHLKSELERMYRYQALVLEIGDETVAKLIHFANGDDPDKSKPQMIVGPHGEGCTCPPDLDPDDESCPTPHSHH